MARIRIATATRTTGANATMETCSPAIQAIPPPRVSVFVIAASTLVGAGSGGYVLTKLPSPTNSAGPNSMRTATERPMRSHAPARRDRRSPATQALLGLQGSGRAKQVSKPAPLKVPTAPVKGRRFPPACRRTPAAPISGQTTTATASSTKAVADRPVPLGSVRPFASTGFVDGAADEVSQKRVLELLRLLVFFLKKLSFAQSSFLSVCKEKGHS